jgi:hypothetical protein
MAIITVPDDEAITIDRFDFDAPAQVNRSGWTKRRKVLDLPGGQSWYFQFHVEGPATEEEERPWRAFLMRLKGPANSFRLRVACEQHTFNNPVVGADPGNGNTLPLQGFLPGTALVAGQFLTVPLPSGHERLVMLTADLTANGSGQATATFIPSLDETPTAGAAVETINPWSLVALTDARNGWALSDGVSEFQFAAEEAL